MISACKLQFKVAGRYSEELKVELKMRPCRNVAYRLYFDDIVTLLLYTTQDLLLNRGMNHGGMCPQTASVKFFKHTHLPTYQSYGIIFLTEVASS